ncbi:helix-turn-helix domain-containing protein [Salinilacihabitans rarus]|uniref:helix-turn-helix domain-containing protein n=1 Tax=Salinilacihabitans rarus TaxID=2961596 RepID=UPI0020C87B5C|nr:helix-turn-helix domain-containing protein [Salinilacihabitans rarus]
MSVTIDRDARDARLKWASEPALDAEAVLTALEDRDCREILAATAETALTASEIADRCEIPRSTLYRKLELLTDASLLEEGIRIRTSGKHASEYRRGFDDVTVTVSGDEGLQVALSQP